MVFLKHISKQSKKVNIESLFFAEKIILKSKYSCKFLAWRSFTRKPNVRENAVIYVYFQCKDCHVIVRLCCCHSINVSINLH